MCASVACTLVTVSDTLCVPSQLAFASCIAKKGKQQLQTRLGSKVHLGCDALALDEVRSGSGSVYCCIVLCAVLHN